MAPSDKGRKRTWRFKLDDSTILEVSAPKGPTEKQVRRRGRVSLVLGTMVVAAVIVGVAIAADTNTDASLSSNAALPTTVSIGSNSFTINVWAAGNIAGSQTGVATVVNKYLMATNGTITPSGDLADRATLNFTTAFNYSQCGSGPTYVQGCAQHPFVVNATVVVAAGTPNNTTGSLTVSMTGSSGLTADGSPDTGHVIVSAPASDTDPPVITHDIGTPQFVNGADTYVTSATVLNFNVNEADHGGSGLKSCTVAVDGPTTSDGSFTCAEGSNNYALGASAPLSLASAPDGSYSSTANATDNADNAATEDSFTVILDNTAPTFGSCTGGPFYLGSGNQAVSITADDAGSGLDAGGSTLSGVVDTSTIGTKTVNYTATDNLGNTANTSCNYSVIFNFHGFFQPVDNNGVFNVVKAGQGIPMKFDLSGDQGLSIFEALYPKSARVPCETTAPQDLIELTMTAGSSTLNYDPTANLPFGQYIYVWKTDKTWAGTCRQFQMKLIDGTTHTANFNFTR